MCARRLLCLAAVLTGLVDAQQDSGRPAITLPGSEDHVHRILVISSYHAGYAWGDRIVQGIRAGFRNTPIRIEPEFEYLDAGRHPQPAYLDLVINFLHAKIADAEPELIIAADDPAVKLVLKYRGTLLPEVPVVFCGVNEFRGSSNYVSSPAERRSWMTGVLEFIDLNATVDLALALHPDAREIVTVGEESDVPYPQTIGTRHPEIRVEAIPAVNLELAETAKRLERLPSDALVLFSAFSRDGAGHRLSIRESAQFVAQHTRVPIYTLSHPSIGYGPIGGKVSDPYAQGKKVASMTLAILGGTPPSALPIERDSANAFEFDYNQLHRWQIKNSSLPGGSIILNEPKSFVQTHPWLATTLTIFLGVQTLIILFLLMQRKRRHAAEAALRTHSQQLAHSNYMLEQFAFITAHDFQEPIRSVALFAELLHREAKDALDSEAQQAVEFIFTNSRRLHSMVRGLLAWVRSVEAPPDSSLWCDASQVWREVVELQRDILERDQVRVEASHLPSLAVHEHHMRELLNRLLENALQHGARRDLKIAIRSERTANGWKLSLYNSGPCIPEGLQSRIFGVFRRLQPAPDSVGMGLAICRRIVDFYGGRIWVESGAREGCTFSFTIPDTPRPRARRSGRWLFQTLPFSSPHAHPDHRG